MGVAGGPNISNDGLVLYMDAANNKSFRGEPTENVIVNAIPLGSWGVHLASSVYPSVTLTKTILEEEGVPFMRFTGVTYDSGYPRVQENNFYSDVTGTFSYSFEARGTPGANLQLNFMEGSSTKIVNSAEISSDWVRYTFDNITTPFILDRCYFRPTTTGAVYDIRNIQAEVKPRSTPFVNGTRGLTVETGGGWVDLSGEGNHGDLVGNPRFLADGRGIEFDGEVDYIQTHLKDTFDEEFSISVWMKRRSGVSENHRGLIGFNQYTFGKGFDVDAGGRFFFEVRVNGAIRRGTIRSPIADILPENKWVFLVGKASLSENFIGFYVNGELKESRPFGSGDEFMLVYDDFYIRSTANDINYVVDEPRVYAHALSEAEILQNFNATKGRYGL